MSRRLVVIGGGRMGEALLAGLVSSGWAGAGELCVIEPIPERRAALSGSLPGVEIQERPPEAAGDVVLAVKPQDVPEACRALAEGGVDRVLSIAAGVTLGALEGGLGSLPVVRAMPNTAARVGAGVAAISAGSRAGEDDMTWAEGVLSAVGDVVRVPEHLLDAVTALSGSGPAYVFLLAEALVDAGVLAGLPRQVSARLAVGTLAGAARMLTETGREPADLRAEVTSPGGTTAAGLRALESAGLRAAVADAVTAAAERSRQLGR